MLATEPISYLWHKFLKEIGVPKNGLIIEVAPGYEPKIGNALALMNFQGVIFLIEPDPEAARSIRNTYQQILPLTTVKIITKPLQKVIVGIDVPATADALVASHPFDDMVIAHLAENIAFFSREKNAGVNDSKDLEKFYTGLRAEDYKEGILATIKTWKDFIGKAKPNLFIASQYPSHTLAVKGLQQRQKSGYIVLDQLKNFYPSSLKAMKTEWLFDYKGNPRWWIIAQQPSKNLNYDLEQTPAAIERLNESIFVPEIARKLNPSEYEIIYIDKTYFERLGYFSIEKQVQNFAITLDNINQSTNETGSIVAYADRQKDRTDIGLDGNLGSGRAVYYGRNFNILGVGKTQLCQSQKPSHCTGKIELMNAMRRIIMSCWINYFFPKAPIHPLLIALKETKQYKWNPDPLPLALLVRIDDGSLDRPSHIEYAPEIPIDFSKTLKEYARLDAECFACRILMGAWSTSNYSLDGRMIDLETASFVKYRGPYYTASDKYPETSFGYEGGGLIRVLRQLAKVKNLRVSGLENQFYKERRRHLGYCFLKLLGISDAEAKIFLSQHQNRVLTLSDQFEKLAKKTTHHETALNLYYPVSDNQDPALLDMSNLFRNLADLKLSHDRETAALNYLIREDARLAFPPYEKEIRQFMRSLFQLLNLLETKKHLGDKPLWRERLRAANQDLPPMFELNKKLSILAEDYRSGKINGKMLGLEVKTLCSLPYQSSRNLSSENKTKWLTTIPIS